MALEAQISPEVFKQTMGLLAGGVAIATCSKIGVRQGLTVTAVCSLTMDPPTVVLCVNKNASAHDTMRETRRISINFLAADQRDLAVLFSSSKIKGDDRFDKARWIEMPGGTWAAIGALAALDCEIISETPVGQHSLFVCEIKFARLEPEKSSLVYFNRAFCKPTPVA